MKSNNRRLQQMFTKYRVNRVPMVTPAPSTKPLECIPGPESSKNFENSKDEGLSTFTPDEQKLLNKDFVATWIQTQQLNNTCATSPSRSATANPSSAVGRLVAYSSSPSSVSSRQSRQSRQSQQTYRHPPQFLMKNSGPQHSTSTMVAKSPSASSLGSSQSIGPFKCPQELTMKISTSQLSKNTEAILSANEDSAADSRDESKRKSSAGPVHLPTSLVAPASESPNGNSGMTRSQLKSRKGSVSKSTPAAEVAHTDHVLDVEDENPRSKKKSNSVSIKHITRTPDVGTTKVLLEQNPGRSARGNNSNKSKPVSSVKRSLTFSDENVNPKRQKLDQKRYGNTSRVVPFTESCSPSTASKGASPTVNSSNISSKSNSGHKSLRKKSVVVYTEENEKEREEHWDFSGSDLDTDKEWKPEGGSEHSSEDGLELSGVESVHSTPLRIQDGGLLGITSNENEGDEISSDSETHKKTAKEMRSERKDKRNSGQAYTSTTGKEIAARIRKPVPPCKRRKCHLIISEDTAESIFNEYWEQSSYDKRVNYICNRIESYTVQRRRARNRNGSQPHPKKVSYKYYFDVGGVRHSVCKDTFLCTLGETDRFLRECARKKKTTLSGIAPDDARGKKKPKHSLKVVLKKKILTHINSYPAYVSHYCRRQTKQKYLPHTLNLKIMCEQFNAQQKANAEEYTDVILSSEEEDAANADQNAATIERAAASTTVSYSTYRRVFSSLNLKFKVPASDTCSTCDTLKMKIKLTKDNEEKQKLTEKHELHLRRAEAAYSLKRQFKAKAKEDSRVGCLIFDLEQVLPTPSVSTGVAYYLRQLNTYNLTIVDASTNITYCYMWHEGEAARGANQIASALYHHLKCEVPDTVQELYLFSDCCSGQNRNSIVSSMFQVLLSMKPSLKSINHIFLIPGHTRMECDTKHSLIERQKKKTATIDVPQDWYNLVRNTSSSFKVTEMAQKFYNFESLTSKDGPLIMREKKEDGSKMYWTKTVWFKYSEPGLVKVKASYNTTAGFDELNMIRGTAKNRRLQKNWWKALSKCNPVNTISEEKKKNLMSLMQYVDSKHHEFYHKLVTDPSIDEDHDPDLPSDNEDDIEEDEEVD